MEILGGSFGIVRSANVRNVLFFLVGICGVFQLVHGRHRDVNVPYETSLKYDSQLTSAEKSDDGELNCMKNISNLKSFSNFKYLLFCTVLQHIHIYIYIYIFSI